MPTVLNEFDLADLNSNMLDFKVKLYFSTQTHQKFNFIGRILGRKGENLKTMESDCECRISILGKGSLRNQEDERQLENAPGYEHLKENLHLLVTTNGPPQQAFYRLAKAISILKPYLHPDTAVNIDSNYKLTNISPLNFEPNLTVIPSIILNPYQESELKSIQPKLNHKTNKSINQNFQYYDLQNVNAIRNSKKPYSRPPRIGINHHQIS